MVRKITVDLWKTGMHKVEVGIKKQMEHQAKSRQFTTDTDIIGEYDYHDEASKGYITIREDPWNADLNEKRLVVKVFTESMNWKASVEEMLAVGITHTLAAGEGMPVYNVNLNNLDRLVRLERVFKPKSMNKAMYSFMFIVDNTVHSFRIEANRLTIGSDWTVFNIHNQEVADINGAGFNVGGKWEITINDDDFIFPPAFDEVLLVFTAIVKYEDNVRAKLEKAADKLKDSEEGFEIKISNEEADLYENPRRLKY